LKYDGSAVNICLSTIRLVEKTSPSSGPYSSVASDQPAVQFRRGAGPQSRSTDAAAGCAAGSDSGPNPPLFPRMLHGLRQGVFATLNMSAIDRNPPCPSRRQAFCGLIPGRVRSMGVRWSRRNGPDGSLAPQLPPPQEFPVKRGVRLLRLLGTAC
jgi:hypothetical protein